MLMVELVSERFCLMRRAGWHSRGGVDGARCEAHLSRTTVREAVRGGRRVTRDRGGHRAQFLLMIEFRNVSQESWPSTHDPEKYVWTGPASSVLGSGY